ncbi:MAG: cbb3-type cytochrome oxidase assembly protein CcoS [Thermodesulfovibrionales bacterium]
MWTITFLIFLSLVLGIGAWLFFVWSVKSGQYDDPEGPKYRMLEDDEDEKKKPAPPDEKK